MATILLVDGFLILIFALMPFFVSELVTNPATIIWELSDNELRATKKVIDILINSLFKIIYYSHSIVAGGLELIS